MTPGDFAQRTASWLRAEGGPATMVLSSRVRLARNLTGSPFPHRATGADRQRVVEEVCRGCRARPAIASLSFIEAGRLSGLERQFLVERHLISPALAGGKGPRGVLVDAAEVLSVMVNEEDHLRIQVILGGYQTRQALHAAGRLAGELGCEMAFARSPRWGYLTACATNAGSGLRASALMHLPGLVLTREMDGVVRGVAQMGFTVRGVFGEGSEPAGNLYQVSNQVTMGRTDEALIDGLDGVVGQLGACEAKARQMLVRNARTQVEDKVWRAWGILRSARLLTSHELMNLSSALRLGVALGVLKEPVLSALDPLMVETRPSHLQMRAGRALEPTERDALRARAVRAALGGEPDLDPDSATP